MQEENGILKTDVKWIKEKVQEMWSLLQSINKGQAQTRQDISILFMRDDDQRSDIKELQNDIKNMKQDMNKVQDCMEEMPKIKKMAKAADKTINEWSTLMRAAWAIISIIGIGNVLAIIIFAIKLFSNG